MSLEDSPSKRAGACSLGKDREPLAFVGACFPPTVLERLIQREEITDIPANVFGWKIVDSLRKNGKHVDVINEHKQPKFPKGQFLSKGYVITEPDVDLYTYRYINVAAIEKISRAVEIYMKLHYLQPTHIVVYSLHTPYLLPVILYKWKAKCKSVLVIPDLPMYMFGKSSSIRRLLKGIDYKLLKQLIKKIDAFVLLTKQMKNELNINAPYTVVEGIVDDGIIPCDEIRSNRGDYIFYSGAVSRNYGLERFIKSFMGTSVDCQLLVCGNGDYAKEIIENAKVDDRIRYLGFLDRDKVRRLQANATLLVNPRDSDDDYTRFSFPSKTVEYMASGVPVMMERLEGIPEEYYSYIIEVKNHDWVTAINRFFEMDRDERSKIGIDGQKFVIEKKNGFIQGKKIVELFELVDK